MVQEKEVTQGKDEVAVVIDPGITQATEIKALTPIMNPDKKGKERAETKKANRHPNLVPLVTASRKIKKANRHPNLVPLVTASRKPQGDPNLVPVTKDRMMRKMVRQNHHTSKQISTLPSMRRP
jgi:hypothetical protein